MEQARAERCLETQWCFRAIQDIWKVHAEDCLGCEMKEGSVDQIQREIVFMGDLTDEQRQRLLDIANKCPVHRTLASEIRIETQLAW